MTRKRKRFFVGAGALALIIGGHHLGGEAGSALIGAGAFCFGWLKRELFPEVPPT